MGRNTYEIHINKLELLESDITGVKLNITKWVFILFITDMQATVGGKCMKKSV
jgi:hypothetical protein